MNLTELVFIVNFKIEAYHGKASQANPCTIGYTFPCSLAPLGVTYTCMLCILLSMDGNS